ncbi:hypothetical protein DFP72DRAFT_1078732 [Ephemerocybe angulata]|uniref:Uncharacterized protein n=1 Tax=Ephemerocybe angulata TaxID=980116 RepID=A0A8H6HCC4_9AGAR|nr:hypothetical protein DFP72DRAFT_1078732 [Tulosesus angulatus]
MSSTLWAHLPGFITHPKGGSAPYKAATKENKERTVLSMRHDIACTDIVQVPVYYTESGGVISEELDLEATHFPNGFVSLPFFAIPNSSRTLPFAYRVFMDPGDQGIPPFNRSIARQLKCPWLGNVVVARYARTNSPGKLCYIHISRQEYDLVASLLAWPLYSCKFATLKVPEYPLLIVPPDSEPSVPHEVLVHRALSRASRPRPSPSLSSLSSNEVLQQDALHVPSHASPPRRD